MVKHPWPLLEISLSDFRRLATLNINTHTLDEDLALLVQIRLTNTDSIRNKGYQEFYLRFLLRIPVYI